MENKVIVNNIRSAIKSKGFTVPIVEETLGFSNGLISRWNKSVPSLDKIISIAELLQISIDDLIGIHPSENNEISDELFINKVIQQTESKVLKWYIRDENTKDSVYNFEEEKKLYDDLESEYYYCKYNEGFFLLQSNYFIEEHQLDELYLFFYIQPDANDSENIVLQIKDEDVLEPLWNVIRYPYYGELTELKAQKLIDQFIEEEYVIKQTENNEDLEKIDLVIEQINKNKELNKSLKILLKYQELIEYVYKNKNTFNLIDINISDRNK